MGIVDRATRDRVSRYIWGVLTLACLGLFLLAREGQDRSLRAEMDAAFERTETYAADVFAPGLVEGRSSPVDGFTGRELYTMVRGEILTDPTAARVRLYDVDGTIVYDTDVLLPGSLVPAENPNAVRALDSGTHGSIVQERFTWSTIGTSGVQTTLLHVYTPLRHADQVGAQGVVEVDYLMEELRAVSRGPWPGVQLAAGALLLLCLAATVLSLRARKPVESASALTDEDLDDLDDEATSSEEVQHETPSAPTPSPIPVAAPVPAYDPKVLELTTKMAALEEAVQRAEDSNAELESVRAREAALEERLGQLEKEVHTPAAEPVIETVPVQDEVLPPAFEREAPEESEGGGLTAAEVSDLRARLAKAAARKRQGPSNGD